jgi:hypothetical protein
VLQSGCATIASLEKQSPTAVLAGSASRARARTTMSRSVMTPSTLSSSTTGSMPMLALSIRRAASVSDADGSMHTTSLTITSRTLLFFLFMVPSLPALPRAPGQGR